MLALPRLLGVAAASLLLTACGGEGGSEGRTEGEPIIIDVELSPDAWSIQHDLFTPNCTSEGCHHHPYPITGCDPRALRCLATPAANLDLTWGYGFEQLIGIPSHDRPSLYRIEPYDADRSYLLKKLDATASQEDRLPHGGPYVYRGPYLSAETLSTVRQWIDEGASLDTLYHDVRTAILADSGTTRTLTGSSADSGSLTWTVHWVRETLDAPEDGGPCSPGEIQLDESISRTRSDGFVSSSTATSCWRVGNFLQKVFDVQRTASVTRYSLLVSSDSSPTTARVWDDHLVGTYNRFEDTNEDGVFDGSGGGDEFIGMKQTGWQLRDEGGRSALRVSEHFFDERGIDIDARFKLIEKTFFITREGEGLEFRLRHASRCRLCTSPLQTTLDITGTIE